MPPSIENTEPAPVSSRAQILRGAAPGWMRLLPSIHPSGTSDLRIALLVFRARPNPRRAKQVSQYSGLRSPIAPRCIQPPAVLDRCSSPNISASIRRQKRECADGI
jgi:hypothetical protein